MFLMFKRCPYDVQPRRTNQESYTVSILLILSSVSLTTQKNHNKLEIQVS